MRAKILVYALPALILATIHLAEAQQPKKVPRIGYLYAGSPSGQLARAQAFLQGLRELGYVEGKNIVIEYRYQRENTNASPGSWLSSCNSK